MSRGIRYDDRVLIVGKAGQGKSTLAEYIAGQMTGVRRTIVDPKGLIDAGVPPARLPEELDLSAPVSHYIPSTLERDEYEELFWLLWRTPGPRLLQLDESTGPTTANWAPRGLILWIQQGRQHGKGLVACTQRPVGIAPPLRTEAEHTLIVVPRTTRDDLATLAGDIGREYRELEDELEWLLAHEGLYSHLWYCRPTNELHRCAPLPLGGAPPVPTPVAEEDRGQATTQAEPQERVSPSHQPEDRADQGETQ
jgi:energy-coupling factor transporter ATP-binding protein EcfA2